MITHEDIDFSTWIPHQPKTWTYKYATLTKDVRFSEWLGHGKGVNGDDFKMYIVEKGTAVQIIMVSRFGDVGITNDMSEDAMNYKARVSVHHLTDYREKP